MGASDTALRLVITDSCAGEPKSRNGTEARNQHLGRVDDTLQRLQVVEECNTDTRT
jgi:hypothetical protein